MGRMPHQLAPYRPALDGQGGVVGCPHGEPTESSSRPTRAGCGRLGLRRWPDPAGRRSTVRTGASAGCAGTGASDRGSGVRERYALPSRSGSRRRREPAGPEGCSLGVDAVPHHHAASSLVLDSGSSASRTLAGASPPGIGSDTRNGLARLPLAADAQQVDGPGQEVVSELRTPVLASLRPGLVQQPDGLSNAAVGEGMNPECRIYFVEHGPLRHSQCSVNLAQEGTEFPPVGAVVPVVGLDGIGPSRRRSRYSLSSSPSRILSAYFSPQRTREQTS